MTCLHNVNLINFVQCWTNYSNLLNTEDNFISNCGINLCVYVSICGGLFHNSFVKRLGHFAWCYKQWKSFVLNIFTLITSQYSWEKQVISGIAHGFNGFHYFHHGNIKFEIWVLLFRLKCEFICTGRKIRSVEVNVKSCRWYWNAGVAKESN